MSDSTLGGRRGDHPAARRARRSLGGAARAVVSGAGIAIGVAACHHAPVEPASVTTTSVSAADRAFADTLQRRSFDWFWDNTDPRTGLTPDRWPTRAFSSIASIGFGLTTYIVGADHGWVPRDAAATRTLTTLQYLWSRPQGPAASGVAGYHGYFYHFLDYDTGTRFRDIELSTIDTGLLMAGVLSCKQYYDGSTATEQAIRAYADSLYQRVDWPFMALPDGGLSMAYHPERGLDQRSEWKGYNEAIILLLLALGSPTHPVDARAWDVWVSGYQWGTFHGQTFLQFGPLFGHEYTESWVDLRGIQDAYMRGHGTDYFENSRRAALSQWQYARDNPGGWRDYGAPLWGVTASDGPGDTTLMVDGRPRHFEPYSGRGAGGDHLDDDGTIAPTGVGGAVPFAPEITLPTLRAMREKYGDALYGRYGFLDALNPTYPDAGHPTQGRVVPGRGWFDTDYLGIDQGPIVLAIENWRSGLVWRLMRGSPEITRGLCRAGFGGGWLAGKC